MRYQDINASVIDNWCKEGWEWGEPISHETFEIARNGRWDVKLTPVKYVPHDWFTEFRGKKILGLASGGGQQMPVFSVLYHAHAGYSGGTQEASLPGPPHGADASDLPVHLYSP